MLEQLISIALLGGVLYAAYRLARLKNRWAGLVIPLLFFLLSLYGAWTMNRFLHTIPEAVDLFIEQMTVLTFLFGNIPTAIALVFYAVGRWRRRRKRQLEDMHIQDLE